MVALPLNIDDSDFDFHTESRLQARTGYTCVAMFLSCIDTFSNITNFEFGIIGGNQILLLLPLPYFTDDSQQMLITPKCVKTSDQRMQIPCKHTETIQRR